ncbi:MAG: mucoidy inhibitor MuiA family protein [Myxococcales bacterium]|jgi:hypothetical protein
MFLADFALALALLAAAPGGSVETPSGLKVESGNAGAAPGSSVGAPQARGAEPEQLALPIAQVTVFSDRARVERRGELKLGKGERRIRLPTLPASLDPGSVRLEARGAEVRAVEVRRARRGELPKDEAKRLLRDLEAAGDEQRALLDRKRVLDEQLALLQGLRPHSSPQQSSQLPPRLLEPAGWTVATSFVDTLSSATAAEIVALEAKLREQAKRLRQLQLQAAELLQAGAGEPGYIVEAVVEPRAASARSELNYLVLGARWLPAYDVRYAPGSAEVEVHFAGLVSQATGEDWVDAKLVLSTAVPATKADLPSSPPGRSATGTSSCRGRNRNRDQPRRARRRRSLGRARGMDPPTTKSCCGARSCRRRKEWRSRSPRSASRTWRPTDTRRRKERRWPRGSLVPPGRRLRRRRLRPGPGLPGNSRQPSWRPIT